MTAGVAVRGAARRRLPVLETMAAAAVLVGFASALFASPAERLMGDLIRILYVHAGAAWTAYLAYGVTALAALVYLRRRDMRWDRLAHASAEVGIILTTITLVTGSLWGKAWQNWWWNWADMRLVLTLLMWFLYVGYLALRRYSEGESRAAGSAVLALAGIPVMILNHFAVTLRQTFHPESIILRPSEPAASTELLWPLGLSLVAYTLVYAALVANRVRLLALDDEVSAAQQR